MNSPCLEQLAKQRERDPDGVDSAIRRLESVQPVIKCNRSDPMAQAMLVAVSDLLVRIFPAVFLDIPDRETRSRAKAAIQAVNPAAVRDGAPRSPTILSIGEQDGNGISINASGWRVCAAGPSQVMAPLPRAEGANGPAALLAGVLGVARVLTSIPGLVKAKAASKPAQFNLWSPDWAMDGPVIPAIISINAHAFGHGSIGHAAWASLLINHSLAGSLTVVDGEAYESHNPARYAFLSRDDHGRNKADALALKGTKEFSILPFVGTVQKWQKANDTRPQLVLICPDNLQARAWAADSLPDVAVSASASEREARVAICNPSHGICGFCTFAPESASLMSQRDAIQAFTGLHMALVNQYTVEWDGRVSPALDRVMVNTIETTRGLPSGAYAHWVGKRLLDFIEANRDELYSAAVLKTTGAERLSLPMPLAGAASGAIAAASLLRVATNGFDETESGFNEYRLDVFTGECSFVANPRPSSQTCLCQHPARIAARRPLKAPDGRT